MKQLNFYFYQYNEISNITILRQYFSKESMGNSLFVFDDGNTLSFSIHESTFNIPILFIFFIEEGLFRYKRTGEKQHGIIFYIILSSIYLSFFNKQKIEMFLMVFSSFVTN